MQELKFHIRDIIAVNQVKPTGAEWRIRCPFDLTFGRQQLDAEQTAAISGTGIYLIERRPKSEVVYLGLFRPMSGNIIALRWSRHLQTITWRGANIGLGPSSNYRTPRAIELRKETLKEAVSHPGLRGVIQAAYDDDWTVRYRSTGNDTSPNRARFASENWDEFSTATPYTVLDNFRFYLLRMSPAPSQETASAQIQRIEKLLLKKYKPVCNRDYKHPLHEQQRAQNTTSTLISAVRATMKEVTGQDVTHCVILGEPNPLGVAINNCSHR